MIDYGNLLSYLHQELAAEFSMITFRTRDVLWSQERDDRLTILYVGIDSIKPLSLYATHKKYNATTQQFDTTYNNTVILELGFDFYCNAITDLTTVSSVHAFLATLSYKAVNFPIALQFIDAVKNSTTPDFVESYVRQRFQWRVFFHAIDEGALSPVVRVKEISGTVVELASKTEGTFKTTL